MTKVKMPEPVAWTVTVGEDFKNCIEITHCKDDAEAQYTESIKGGYESLYLLRSLITTDQAEAYATDRVRKALEDAAHICWLLRCSDEFEPEVQDRMLKQAEVRIRALKSQPVQKDATQQEIKP